MAPFCHEVNHPRQSWCLGTDTHSGERGGKVHCFQGVSRLMNVCSVLITTLDYVNPPSELRRVTRTEGSERSKVKPSPLLPPNITVSSLNYSLLSIFARTPSFSPHLHPQSVLPPTTIPLGLLLFCVSFPLLPCCSWERRWLSLPVSLNGLGPLSITTALCSVKAAFAGYFNENEVGTRWKLQAWVP